MTDTPPRTFGILLFDGVEELDFVGPWEMLRMWSLYADGPPECLLVAQSDGAGRLRQGHARTAALRLRRLPAAGRAAGARRPRHAQRGRQPGAGGLRAPPVGAGAGDDVGMHRLACAACRRTAGGPPRHHALGHAAAPAHSGRRAGGRRALRAGRPGMELGRRVGRHRHDAGLHRPHCRRRHRRQVQLAAEYYPDGVRYGDQPRDPRAPAYVRGG